MDGKTKFNNNGITIINLTKLIIKKKRFLFFK